MPKNEIKAKSTTRKPLRDVSNGNIMFSKPVNKKAPHDTNDGDKAPHNTNDGDEVQDDNALDRLLLVHTHLSSLIHQMDELVVQALKVKSNKGRKEVQSFTQVLTEIQSSLKPWVPIFQKALSSNTIVYEEDTNVEVQSPEHTKYDSQVSPSPLVSWHDDCTIEIGRQLFLLTPLPRHNKVFPSKLQCQSKYEIEKITSKPTFKAGSRIDICGHTYDDLPQNDISQEPLSKNGCSLLVMTPCRKMSPPKSCVLLEPISELSRRNNRGFRKSTPYPVGIQDLSCSETSESSGSEASESLALKYPELFGIQKVGNGRKGVEASPDWFISPPKTCVLMEPPDEKSLASKYQIPQNLLIECTPMLKEPESTFQTGKRAGENTLKRELWTRFEAASVRGVVSNISLLQETARKGFLDRLEEVSFDEDKSGA